jgi:hypothetical protein
MIENKFFLAVWGAILSFLKLVFSYLRRVKLTQETQPSDQQDSTTNNNGFPDGMEQSGYLLFISFVCFFVDNLTTVSGTYMIFVGNPLTATGTAQYTAAGVAILVAFVMPYFLFNAYPIAKMNSFTLSGLGFKAALAICIFWDMYTSYYGIRYVTASFSSEALLNQEFDLGSISFSKWLLSYFLIFLLFFGTINFGRLWKTKK